MAQGKSSNIESIKDIVPDIDASGRLGIRVIGTVPVSGPVDANIQVGDVDASETNPVPSRDVAETYSAPTFATVGTGSGVVAAANATRRMVVIVNDSDTTVYLAVGNPAVVGSGIRVNANGGVAQFGGPGGLALTTAAINGIASAASKNVTVQEAT